jgi:hypothetical protein
VESADFVFASGIRLRVSGDRGALSHARREYGPAEAAAANGVDLEVTFGPIGRDDHEPAPGAIRPGRGGHKTAAWSVDPGDPEAAPIRARIETRGWPRSFARSLVQGYVVEPLLSIATARRGIVLLPGAGIVLDDGLVLLLGRSRAGKSTLAARALTARREVLGDDQLFVGPDGSAWPFPRSYRFYPDLVDTAPRAYAALRGRSRAGLRARAVLARLSAGYVRPSLAIEGAELGLRWKPGGRPIARLVLIERDATQDQLDVAPGSADEAVEWSAALLREQRSRLKAIGGAAWGRAIDQAADLERGILAASFQGLRVDRLAIPASWDAPTAVTATARRLGIEAA